MDVGSENPLTRIAASGWSGASMSDLLALGLAAGEGDLADSEVRAQELMRELGGVHYASEISRDQIRSRTGFEDFRVLQCMAWLELGRRSGEAKIGPQNAIHGPIDVERILGYLKRERREHFVVMLLNAKNMLIRAATIHIGTLTTSVVGAREVFREAIREGASSIIVAHNHPSGDPEPSPEDIDITLKLAEVGRLIDIVVWDHIVFGRNGAVSLRARGVLDHIGRSSAERPKPEAAELR